MRPHCLSHTHPHCRRISREWTDNRDLGRKFSGGAAHSAQRHRRRVGVAAATGVVQRGSSPESPSHHRRPPQLPERCRAGPRHARRFLRLPQGHNPWASCWLNHLKAGAHAPAMDYVSGSRARTLLTTARALQQECRMPHCDIMPRCDKMPQLHRFSWTAIEYSMVHSEGAADLF